MTSVTYRCPVVVFGLLTAALVGYMYAESLVFLISQWGNDDYSHGPFVPLISAVIAWQHRHQLRALGMAPSWWGPAVVLTGLLFYIIGNLTTVYLILHLSLWVVILGLVVSFIGCIALRELAFPLAYLLSAIPLPVFLYTTLSSQLQLWSSALGVGFLQGIGVTAFREGNVIDLGLVQLQVAEACSGIRYLLPLTSLAILCAYFSRDRTWKRILLALSALPISVLVNGIRIGIVGLLVEFYGPQAAEGFLHLFEGWILFLATLGILLMEMWGLSRVQPLCDSRRFSEWFALREVTSPAVRSLSEDDSVSTAPTFLPAYVGSFALILPIAFLPWSMGEKYETPPERVSLVDFPMQIGDWQGTTLPIESQFISALRFDDYLLAEYASVGGSPITLYLAYYRSQRKGQSAHSPQSCIPGGGWEITSQQTINLNADIGKNFVASVNRVLIQKDRQKQLVIYWFKQRDRFLSNEYLVKFYLLWDSMTRQRSDGALIRLSSVIEPGESEQKTETRLLGFARNIDHHLNRYIPD